MRGQVAVTANFVAKGSSADDFKLYAKIRMDINSSGVSGTYEIPARLDITQVSGGSKITLYMRLNVSMTQNGETSSMALNLYGTVNSSTGELDLAEWAPNFMGSSSSANMKTIVNGSAVTTINRSQSGTSTPYVSVAYGDDTAGGIASFYSYETGKDYFWGEYYGATGDLLLRANGNTVIWNPIGDETRYPNLSAIYTTSAPDTVYLRANGSVYEVSTDGTTNWTTVSGFDTATGLWGLFWRAGTTWAGGDTVYYGNECSWDNNLNTWVTKYTVGYRVPTPEQHFGSSFYMSYEYPLKNLLPLSATYAAAYKLMQQEGETYTWNWVDWNGVAQTSGYTQYTYYLDHTGTGSTSYDAADEDIDLTSSLSSYDMYYYENGQSKSTLGYFLRTMGSVPAYFTSPDQTARNHVDAQLQSALTTAYNMNTDSYTDEFALVDTDTVFSSF